MYIIMQLHVGNVLNEALQILPKYGFSFLFNV